ncbi:lasso peptide biosynthesis PqqD family chaperone [Cohnella faecalis]|uniref:Lasso peptide biosynthesis PqqD family chaperone n=1 Tax=Cohnella faecalis TaxID=2315694 RepID=A0A398CPM7_9BACL|nr:lasso peptide biosynthesis PqqD family chaperone [Cohnella faecalis]RIE05366.1 lasso peptide biosynthesis PqqD family chaperone [Cohnella faecalis]
MNIIGNDHAQTVVQAEGSIVSDMNGEMIMFSTRTGKYYNLGSVGGRIWELIAAPVAVGRLVDELTAEFEVERGECARQVGEFLRCMHLESLIEVRSS